MDPADDESAADMKNFATNADHNHLMPAGYDVEDRYTTGFR